jgi:hypothetical protein
MVALAIPLVAIVLGIGCGWWSIYWEHKKDIALIEKGLYQQYCVDSSLFCYQGEEGNILKVSQRRIPIATS